MFRLVLARCLAQYVIGRILAHSLGGHFAIMRDSVLWSEDAKWLAELKAANKILIWRSQHGADNASQVKG
jgi:hypothetical protein